MKSPHRTVTLDGRSLTIAQVINVAHHNAEVLLDSKALKRMAASREFIKEQAEANRIVYGVTTGFGPNADTIVLGEKSKQLQRNLIISHAAGVGKNFSVKIVRAIVLIRLNTLMAGHSGIRLDVVRFFQRLLNEKIHPIIPQQGSVGSSGDLAPLSHMALPILGVGNVMLEWNKKVAAFFKKKSKPSTIFEEDGKKYAILPAQKVLTTFEIEPLELSYKEGLAMNNGTSVMAALGVEGVHQAQQMIQLGTLSATLSFEALCARGTAFDRRLHVVRNHKEQAVIAKKVRSFTKGSDLFNISTTTLLQSLKNAGSVLQKEKNEGQEDFYDRIFQIQKGLKISSLDQMLTTKNIKYFLENAPQLFCDFLQNKYLKQETYDENGDVKKMPEWKTWQGLVELARKKVTPQDAYSVRCLPQIFGASLRAIHHVEQTIQAELNAVVDNPIIFLNGKKGTVLSGGNFHGQPLALVLDYLKLAVAEMGNLLERQVNKLMDKHHNEILPPFLAEQTGLHSGLMILQYTAASLVSENKVLVHPASADSIPTSMNQEDHNSMGTIAGRQALEIIGNVEKILTIHLLTAAQAVEMRQQQFKKAKLPTKLADATQQLLTAIRKSGVQYLAEDRWIKEDLDLVEGHLGKLYSLSKKLWEKKL